MMPNVQPSRKARGRLLVFLTSTALWGLAVLSAVKPEPALALNGVTRAMSCQNCFSSNDFIVSALAQANALARPGLYVVVSQTYARTAFIAVTGEPPPNCIPSMGCNPNYLINATATALVEGGGPLGSDSDLNGIDVGLFGMDRTVPLVVNLPLDCGGAQSGCGASFAGSNDTAVGLGIGAALQAAGVNTAILPQVISIAVKFKNGDVAVYQHIPGQGGYSWKWGRKAWNSAGQPIDQNGHVIQNPNTAGGGSGTGSGTAQGPLGVLTFGFSGYSACVFNANEIFPPAGGASGDTVIIVASYAPC